MTGQLMTFPDATVFVREVGEGTPVLLVNGLGAHTAMWEPLERSMPDDAHVSFNQPEQVPHFAGGLFCVERQHQYVAIAIGQMPQTRLAAIQIQRVADWRLL